MNQINLSQPEHRSYTARVADLFLLHPNIWLDSSRIAHVGGACAWRTRVSECRKFPFNLTIENRVRRVVVYGHVIAISEYRLIARDVRAEEEAADSVSAQPAAV